MSLVVLVLVGLFFAAFLSVWTYVWGWLVAVRSARMLLTSVAVRLTGTDVAAVDSGRVTVTGTAREDVETVQAPLSGTACLAYQVHVMQNNSDGGYLAVETVADGARFDVHDDVGQVGVDPADAVLDFPECESVTGDPNDDHPDRVRELVDAAAPYFESEYSKGFRLREHRLHDGDDVVVHGVASDGGRARIADAPEATGVVDRMLGESFLVASSDEVPTSVIGSLLGIAIGAAATVLPLVAVYNEFLA